MTEEGLFNGTALETNVILLLPVSPNEETGAHSGYTTMRLKHRRLCNTILVAWFVGLTTDYLGDCIILNQIKLDNNVAAARNKDLFIREAQTGGQLNSRRGYLADSRSSVSI